MNLHVTVDLLIECCVTQTVQRNPPLRSEGDSNPGNNVSEPVESNAYFVPRGGPHQTTHIPHNDTRSLPTAKSQDYAGIALKETRNDQTQYQQGNGGHGEVNKQHHKHESRLKDDWRSIFYQDGGEHDVDQDAAVNIMPKRNDGKSARNQETPIPNRPPKPPMPPKKSLRVHWKNPPAQEGVSNEKYQSGVGEGADKELMLKSSNLLDGYENDTGEFARGKCGGAEAAPMFKIFQEKSGVRKGMPPSGVGMKRCGSRRKLNFLKSLEAKDRKLEVLAKKYRGGCALVRGKKLPTSWILGAIRALQKSEREMRVTDGNYMKGKPPLPGKRKCEVKDVVEENGKKEVGEVPPANMDARTSLDLNQPGAGRCHVGEARTPKNKGDMKLTNSSRMEMLTALRQRLSKQQLRKSIDGALDQRRKFPEMEPTGRQEPVQTRMTTRARRSMEEERNWFSRKFSTTAFTSNHPTKDPTHPFGQDAPMNGINPHHPSRHVPSISRPPMQPVASSSKGVVSMPDEENIKKRRKSFADLRSSVRGGVESLACVSKARLLRMGKAKGCTEGEVLGGGRDSECLKLLQTEHGC